MNHKCTVIVGIPAHNEEVNIGNLLNAIICQKGDNFTLEKIIVMADGCTDKTEEIVKEAAERDKRILLLADGKRYGKAHRLNQLYRLSQSDCLVTFDADVVLGHKHVIEQLVASLFSHNDIAVAAGNPQPLSGRTLVGKMYAIHFKWWYEIRKDFSVGDNIYNSSGCVYAFKKSFSEQLFLENGTVNDQEVIYMAVKTLGKKFSFVKQAIIYFGAPSVWREWRLHNNRLSIRDTKGKEALDERKIPWQYKAHILKQYVCRAPVSAVLGTIIHILFEFIMPEFHNPLSQPIQGTWDPLPSTKALFFKK